MWPFYIKIFIFSVFWLLIHSKSGDCVELTLIKGLLGIRSLLFNLQSHLCLIITARSTYYSVQSLSCVQLFGTPWTAAHQGLPVHHQLPEFTQTHVHWVRCHPTISSSVVPFSSCPQSFPASGSFQMTQLFASSGQSIGVSASASVLPMNTRTDLL